MATETSTHPQDPEAENPTSDQEAEEEPEEDFSLPVISVTLLRRVLELLTACEELDYTQAESRGKFQALFTRDEWDRIYRDCMTETGLPYEAQRLDQFREEHTDVIFAMPAKTTEEDQATRLACQFAMIESAGIASQAQLEFIIALCKSLSKPE